jgi:hypothetical protein
MHTTLYTICGNREAIRICTMDVVSKIFDNMCIMDRQSDLFTIPQNILYYR